LDINYLGEVKPGQTVELWQTEIPAEGWDWAAAFEGRRSEDKRDNNTPVSPAFRGELRIARDPC
jgi:hypothetical protein